MRDYEKLVKALRCCHLTSGSGCAECPRRLENNDSCYKLLPDAADAIEELLKENAELDNSGRVLMAAFARLKEKAPRWISVEERLPESGERVLIMFNPFEDDENISIGWLTKSGFDCYDDSVYFFRSVTHWMPLPEAPKEGTE